MQKAKKYNFAVFHYVQAAEKAVKALLHYFNTRPWGHSITKLLTDYEQIRKKIFPEAKVWAGDLEDHYTTSRYPDGGPGKGIKVKYDKKLSKKLPELARRFLDFVEQEKRGVLAP